MKVTVVGYDHHSGVSRHSGKAFDFYNVYFTYECPRPGVVGCISDHCVIPAPQAEFLKAHRTCPFSMIFSFDTRGEFVSAS